MKASWASRHRDGLPLIDVLQFLAPISDLFCSPQAAVSCILLGASDSYTVSSVGSSLLSCGTGFLLFPLQSRSNQVPKQVNKSMNKGNTHVTHTISNLLMQLNPALLSCVSLPSGPHSFFKELVPLRHPSHLRFLCLDSAHRFHLLQIDYNVNPLSLQLLKPSALSFQTPVYDCCTVSSGASLNEVLVVSSQNNPLKFYALQDEDEQDLQIPQLAASYPLYSEDHLKLENPLTLGFNNFNNSLYCGLTSEIVRLNLNEFGTTQGSPERFSPMKRANKKKKWMYSCCDFLQNLSVFGTYEPPSIILGDQRMRRSLEILTEANMPHSHGIQQVSLLSQYLLLSSARCQENLILWDLRMTPKYMDQLQTQFMKGYPEELNDFLESKSPAQDTNPEFNIVQFYSQSQSHQHFKYSLLDRENALLMAKGGSDGYIAVYEIGTGQCKAYFKGHQAPVGDVKLISHPFHKDKLLQLSCSGTRQFDLEVSGVQEESEDEVKSEEEKGGLGKESTIKLRELKK